MVTPPPGRSLAELLVALTFLGCTLGAVGASTVLGTRWSADAVARQRALELAGMVLDSVTAAEAPGPGTVSRDGLTATWAVDGAAVEVRVSRRPGEIALAELRGRIVPNVPALPVRESAP
jgi:hypothetical protein